MVNKNGRVLQSKKKCYRVVLFCPTAPISAAYKITLRCTRLTGVLFIQDPYLHHHIIRLYGHTAFPNKHVVV